MIEYEIVQELLNAGTVTALVGSGSSARINYGIASQGQELPRINLHRISTDRPATNDGSVGLAQALIQVDSWANTYAGAKALADEVRAALVHVQRVTAAGETIVDITFQGQRDLDLSPTGGEELPVFGDSQDFLVTYHGS